MNEPRRSPFAEPEVPLRARWVALLTIMAGSLTVLFPVVSTIPWMPPFGLMMLLGWRLLRPDLLKVYLAVPLGLFDDLVSGQPLGSAMLLWTTCFIAIDVLDTRLVWRDFWQDWLLATGVIGFCLIGGRFLASPISAHVDTLLLVQILLSALLFPLVSRITAALDARGKR